MNSNKRTKTKNDKFWVQIFEKYKILDEIEKKGHFIITSKQINEFRESRLMTKFDHKQNLPIIFEDNNLSILPLTRGSYIISKFKAYQEIKYSDIKPISVDKRTDLESLDYANIYSESAALNCALASGIIRDVLGEECELTINGRMSSKSFEFYIKEEIGEYKKQKINVENSQCEIDGGFESENKLAIIEAKNTLCDNFLIRQLYYPYRLWQDKVSKKVVPIFMTYSNDKFSFFIYDFEEKDNYNSLKLVEQKDYIIAPEPITLNDIKEILKSVKIIKEPKVPFPQADRFDRIVDLLGLLVNEDLSKEDMTLNYDFDKRQTDYYFNGGRYLDLIERYKGKNEKYEICIDFVKDLGLFVEIETKDDNLLNYFRENIPFNYKEIRHGYTNLYAKEVLNIDIPNFKERFLSNSNWNFLNKQKEIVENIIKEN